MKPDPTATLGVMIAGLDKGFADTVAKLFHVLASGQGDEASLERFDKGLQKAVELYEEAIRRLPVFEET